MTNDTQEQEQEQSARGNCYEVAATLMYIRRGIVLCHGRPVYRGRSLPGLIEPGDRYNHAWNESSDRRRVYDRSNGLTIDWPREVYYRMGNMTDDDVVVYTREEAYKHIESTGTYGPWG